jgi:hypothetical protein
MLEDIRRGSSWSLGLVLLVACSGGSEKAGGGAPDGSVAAEAGPTEDGATDTGIEDASTDDAMLDTGLDASDTPIDSGLDSGGDAGLDAGKTADAGDASAAAPTSFYVNVATGSDANSGSQLSPWKTITHAIATVPAGAIDIVVAPGTYNAASGETFPLMPGADQNIVGDVANAGQGTKPTQLAGTGTTGTVCPYTPYQTTVLFGPASTNASFRGFVIGGGGTAESVFACGSPATLANDTLSGASQESIIAVAGTALTLTSNTISNGIYLGGATTKLTARGNTMVGGYYALQLCNGAGCAYTGSFIDVGTAASPGNNTLIGSASAVGLALVGTSASVVQAAGNTWHPSVQGANAAGHYATAFVDGTTGVALTAGNNYSIAAGAGGGIQF